MPVQLRKIRSSRLWPAVRWLFILVVALSLPTPTLQAQAVDSHELALSADALPAGFVADDAASNFLEAPDGTTHAVRVYRQTAPDGERLIRSTVTLTTNVGIARGIYARLPELLADQGFTPLASPALGDESAAFSSPDTLDGQAVVYWSVIFRRDRVVAITTLVEPAGAAALDDANTLAALVADRVNLAIGPGQTAASSSGSALAAAAVTTAPLPSEPTAMSAMVAVDSPNIGGGLTLGGFSGLGALDQTGTSFVTVTDRGPNQDIKIHGDKGAVFLLPDYTPSILRLAIDQGQLRVVDRVPLRLPKGRDRVTGEREISGLPNSGRDQPAFDSDRHKDLGVDPNGVDTEGIAVDPRDGSYWLCEEYGPSILHVGTDGTVLLRLVPAGLNLRGAGYPVRASLPGDLLKRKPNRGFEGIALSPDGGTLFAIMQSPLSNPSERTGEASRNVRIVAIDLTNGPRTDAMYLYQTEPHGTVGVAEQDDVKIGDLAAINATRLLVTERDSGSGGHRKVYVVDLARATDLLGRRAGKKPLEAMSDGEAARASITPVTKQVLVDLTDLGYGHELVEGLTIVDDTTLAVVNDNNFNPREPSELMLIQLPAPLR